MGFQLPTSIGEFTGFLPTYPSHSLLLSCLCKSKELGWHPSDVEVGSRGGWIRQSRSPAFIQQRIRIFQRKKILKSFKNSKFTSKKSVFVKNGRLYNYISTDVTFPGEKSQMMGCIRSHSSKDGMGGGKMCNSVLLHPTWNLKEPVLMDGNGETPIF